MITIDPDDLAALVERLDREHFGYNDRGAAALRAFRGLERAVDEDAAIVVFASTPATDNKRKQP